MFCAVTVSRGNLSTSCLSGRAAVARASTRRSKTSPPKVIGDRPSPRASGLGSPPVSVHDTKRDEPGPDVPTHGPLPGSSRSRRRPLCARGATLDPATLHPPDHRIVERSSATSMTPEPATRTVLHGQIPQGTPPHPAPSPSPDAEPPPVFQKIIIRATEEIKFHRTYYRQKSSSGGIIEGAPAHQGRGITT